jgi:hypothetical protein
MPNPFPILEDQTGWAELVARVGSPEVPKNTGASSAGGSVPA